MVLKKKHQSAMQRNDKAISAMSRISEGKLDAEKSKSLSQSLDLKATISVQQQDNLQLKESLNDSIVEARSSKMELRKELTHEIIEKKSTISSMAKELKAVNTIQACVRRQRVEIQSLKQKKQEALNVSSKRQKNARSDKDLVADLRGQMDNMRLSFDEELNKKEDEIVLEKKRGEGFKQEIAQATEEIVVSYFIF